MTFEKYQQEVEIITKFVSLYCKDKHGDVPRKGMSVSLMYRAERAEPIETTLCEECNEVVAYAIARLQGCPFEDKPKCRKCPNPCYERPMWKKVARIMRYSGMKLGMNKLREKVRFWEQNEHIA